MPVIRQANRAILFTLLIGLLFWQSINLVRGQVDTSDWTVPVNLSQSGSGAKPYIFMDANQQYHVLWQDVLEDLFVYVKGENGEWGQPTPIELPFGPHAFSQSQPTPLFDLQLVVDDSSFVHAFWLGGESELFLSSVPVDGFADFGSWTAPRVLGQDVVKFEVLTGANGGLHLTYITNNETTEIPAGLYYRRSNDGGETWSEPNELYQSPYLRLLTPDNAHLKISKDNQDLYITWDNRPRDRIFLIHSQNNGTSWGEPEVIDQRMEGDSSEDVSPRNILVANYNGELHLTWQAGHDGITCTQFHLWSVDEGATWQTAPNFWNSFQGCPDNIQFLTGDPGLFLLASILDARYLLVWDAGDWYDPQLQPELTAFVDEDVFRPVTFNCGQTALVDGSELVVASCGQGTERDVWLTSRSLSSLVESLQVTPIWSIPTQLEGGSRAISNPSLIVDAENNLHLLWQQINEESTGSAIYYSIQDNLNWSSPTAVLTSPNGEAEQPSFALSQDGNFLAVWSGSPVGEIYFSRVAVEQARIASAWSDPVTLPTVRAAAAAPNIFVDNDGVIHVVYAIPLNENRGIYTVSSEDRGASWSEPILVFDAVAESWDMVDQPKLFINRDGSKHLSWLRRPIMASVTDDAMLYYAYTQSNERNWSEPELIQSSSQQDTAVVWHKIFGFGERIVHRTWQEQQNGRISLWHQISMDNGLTWNQPFRIDESTSVSSAQVTLDKAGQTFIVVAKTESNINNNSLSGVLNQWVLQDDRWQAEETFQLAQLPVQRTANVAITTTGDGRLAVVYTGQSENEELPELLWFTQRELPILEVTPTPLPTLTPTPEPTGTPTPTATPEPTPEIVFPVDQGGGGPSLPLIGNLSGNRIIIVGAILAAIPIGAVSVLVLIRRARSNRY